MIKLICVKKGKQLTLHKIYDGEFISTTTTTKILRGYKVVGDDGWVVVSVIGEYFMTLAEWRDNRINSILND